MNTPLLSSLLPPTLLAGLVFAGPSAQAEPADEADASLAAASPRGAEEDASTLASVDIEGSTRLSDRPEKRELPIDEARASASGLRRVTLFEDYDTSGDGELDVAELVAGIGPLFRSWDFDGDERLAGLEVVHGMFVAWDVNGDGKIDEVELTDGASTWMPDRAGIKYGDFDGDGDREVSLVELTSGFLAEDLGVVYRARDTTLTSSELAQGIMDAFDKNDDGKLSRAEWPLG